MLCESGVIEMHAPDMQSAIENADDTRRYVGLLHQHAKAVKKVFPSGNEDCCVAFATELARAFDSHVCSTKTLDRVLERALSTC
jgi:hypothetical protein